MVVLVLTAVFVAFSLLKAAVTADLFRVPSGWPMTGLSFAVSLAVCISIIGWARLTKRVVESRGGRGTVVRNWALYGGSIIRVLSILLTTASSAVFHVARAVGAVLFLVGLLISRAQLQRWLAQPHVPGVPATEPFHRPLLAPVET